MRKFVRNFVRNFFLKYSIICLKYKAYYPLNKTEKKNNIKKKPACPYWVRVSHLVR